LDDKKLIVLKQAEKPRDKKELVNYLKSPADFTVLIFLHDGSISNPESEPYKTLANQGYLFEAKELKGKSLIDWLILNVEKNGKTISENINCLQIFPAKQKYFESQRKDFYLYRR
jgi:DNA polymerase III delta subunit